MVYSDKLTDPVKQAVSFLLILEDRVHVMSLPNQLAPKQITNLQRSHKRLQTQDLRKQESMIKFSN